MAGRDLCRDCLHHPVVRGSRYCTDCLNDLLRRTRPEALRVTSPWVSRMMAREGKPKELAR